MVNLSCWFVPNCSLLKPFSWKQKKWNEIFRWGKVWRCLVLSPQSHRTVSSLWRESGLSWTDFLPEGEDVQAFISQQVGNTDIDVLFLHCSAFFCPFDHLSCMCHFPVILTSSPLDPNRNSSSFCRTAPALRRLGLKGSCLLRSWASSWRDSSWRTWPVTSRSLTGWRYDTWHIYAHISHSLLATG